MFDLFQIGSKPLFYIEEYKYYLSKLETDKIICDLKINSNTFDYEVLNVTVFQNLSNAQTKNEDISDFPVIYQTNGNMYFILYLCLTNHFLSKIVL